VKIEQQKKTIESQRQYILSENTKIVQAQQLKAEER